MAADLVMRAIGSSKFLADAQGVAGDPEGRAVIGDHALDGDAQPQTLSKKEGHDDTKAENWRSRAPRLSSHDGFWMNVARGCAQSGTLLFCATPRNPGLAMIRCHLSTFMGRDKLRISDVSRLTGLNRSTVSALYKETVTRLDVAAIDALCNLFRCSVGELFEHVPDTDRSVL